MDSSEAPSTAPEPLKITITLPTSAYFISGIRNFTLEMVKNMTQFSEQWAFRFQSVVDELCNNAIEHGSKDGEEIKISFLCQKDEYLEILVEDSGTGSNKKSPEEMKKLLLENQQRDPNLLTSLRGRGLPYIVANWTDVLEFKNSEKGGLTVRVVKYLNTPENRATSLTSSPQTNQVYKI